MKIMYEFRVFSDIWLPFELNSLAIRTISPSLEKEANYARLRLLIERGVTPAIGHDLVANEDAILGALRVVINIAVFLFFDIKEF